MYRYRYMAGLKSILSFPQRSDRQGPQGVAKRQALLAQIKHHAARKFVAGRLEHQIHLLSGRKEKAVVQP